MRTAAFLAIFCATLSCFAQKEIAITGQILDQASKRPISNTSISLVGSIYETSTDSEGYFVLHLQAVGEQLLQVEALDFITKRFSIELNEETLEFGQILLERDIVTEKTDNLITLTEGDLQDTEDELSGSMGLLQSTRDIFLNRAAFDFGQAFFKVRGYDSRNGVVLLNGIPMNKFFDRRPQWNNWGGLNDVVRNQEYSQALSSNPYTFGGILGNTNINMLPSGFRPGIRLSSSASNRTYRGRLMATYNSGLSEKGLAYSISASRRWADEGYVEGTLYDAYSFFAAVEYKPNTNHSISLATIMARNRRGRSAALTQEVFELKGNQYNPYWGEQNGKTRNTRERDIFEPLFLLNYALELPKIRFQTGIGYQFGTHSRSRLGYFNAPNPDPTYYRYLPSYAINSSIGASFINAEIAKEGFLENAQVDWPFIYNANANNAGLAAYIFYDDVVKDNTLSLSTSGTYKLHDAIEIDFGGYYRTLTSDNYAEINDLLGATFHRDVDAFSNTRNDISGNLEKVEGDKFNYHYNLKAEEVNLFFQTSYADNNWMGFASASLTSFNTQRNGLFSNERFLDNSLGASEKISFSNFAFKGGATYFITGRHWVTINAAEILRPPTLQNTFINPRENNLTVPDIQNEKISTLDLGYHFRLPNVTGRISAFYTRFQNTTDINFFFVDSGLGSDFVQEVITGLDRLHKGIELGIEYDLSSNVKLSAVGNLGHYVYASDPSVQINFDTAGVQEELIDPEGSIHLGIAKLKDLKLAQGPQTAFALGVEYRDPKYWWIGASANHLTNNFASISTITRTSSFSIDPDTKESFLGATEENVSNLLQQKPLDDIYLLNLVGGKSWLFGKKYISFFASVNNLFDSVFRTGGYEQSRNGNFGQLQQDNLSGNPSFGPKYWYSFGRTYFLNLAISF